MQGVPRNFIAYPLFGLLIESYLTPSDSKTKRGTIVSAIFYDNDKDLSLFWRENALASTSRGI